MDIPKEEREKEAGSLFKEMIPENFPNLGKEWIYKSMKLIS